MRPLRIIPLADAPSFILGLSIIRGEPVPVVDLARLVAGERSAPTRFVLINVGDRRVALAVDKVVGIDIVDEAEFKRLPSLLGGASGDVLAAVGALDSELCLILDNARLVPDAVWSTIDLAGS
jgi:purine-binding chemotaxis protein CheW